MVNYLFPVLSLFCFFVKISTVPVPIKLPNTHHLDDNKASAVLKSIESIQLYELNDKQTLAEVSLRGGYGNTVSRRKRTVGMLRQFFPEITKNLDDAVDKIIAQLIGVLAPVFLRNGGLNLGGGGLTRNSQVTVDLGDDFDLDDDFESNETSNNSTDDAITTVSSNNNDLFINEIEKDSNSSSVISLDDETKKKRTVRSVNSQIDQLKKTENLEDFEEYDDDDIAVAGSENVQKTDSKLSKVDFEDDEDDIDESRNKRNSGSDDFGSTGTQPGSGNFLFDIIRLVSSGSSSGQTPTDGSDGTSLDIGAGKNIGIFSTGDAHSFKPIPGPITRLFVIANRSIANLMQDLILRLAETSERLVNFKARLITALI